MSRSFANCRTTRSSLSVGTLRPVRGDTRVAVGEVSNANVTHGLVPKNARNRVAVEPGGPRTESFNRYAVATGLFVVRGLRSRCSLYPRLLMFGSYGAEPPCRRLPAAVCGQQQSQRVSACPPATRRLEVAGTGSRLSLGTFRPVRGDTTVAVGEVSNANGTHGCVAQNVRNHVVVEPGGPRTESFNRYAVAMGFPVVRGFRSRCSLHPRLFMFGSYGAALLASAGLRDEIAERGPCNPSHRQGMRKNGSIH